MLGKNKGIPNKVWTSVNTNVSIYSFFSCGKSTISNVRC